MEGENAQAAHFGEQSVAFLYFGRKCRFYCGNENIFSQDKAFEIYGGSSPYFVDTGNHRIFCLHETVCIML